MSDIRTMPSIIIRDIDEGLRKELRMICLQNGISMNQQMKILIKEFVDKNRIQRK